MKRTMFTLALLSAMPGVYLCAQPDPLRSLNAIHVLSNEQAAQHLPVDFEATVTYFRGSEHTLFIQDGEVAIYVQASTGLKLTPGDRIRVRGTTHESFRPFVLATDIAIVGHGELPNPVTATFDDLIRARYDCRMVTVRAQVRSADVIKLATENSSLQLLTDGGYIQATVNTADETALKSLLDAEVEITGPASGRFDGKMQQTGVLVHLSSIASIRRIKAAALDPWSLPITPMDEILTGYHVTSTTARTRVQGTVTYYEPGSAVVLQSGSKSVWVRTQSHMDLKVGDVADATGIPDVQDGFLTLTRAEIRDSGARAPVQARLSTWSELTRSHHIFDLVSVQGKVVMEVREGAQDEYVLMNEGHLFSAIVRHPVATYAETSPPALAAMKHVPLGSTVQVTGICILADSDPFDVNVPFNLMLRSFDDIEVISSPTWLNVRNLVRLVSVLTVLMLIVSGWGWTLRRKVAHQAEILAARAKDEATLARRNAQLQQQRSQILEDINGTRPLVEVLEQITALVSFQLDGALCWCEIADGPRLGNYPRNAEELRVVREAIPGRSGKSPGVLCAGFDLQTVPAANEQESFFLGTRLATLAIETRRLYSDLVHRSEFDLLTEIHNRFSLDRQFDILIARAREEAGIFGLIYVDLDEFKQVNDKYGHHVGDVYLQEVSQRMKHQLRGGDLLARLGGDEFAILVPVLHNRTDLEEIASRLQDCFAKPFEIDGYVLRGSASVGFAIYPEDGASKDSLLSAADAAMYVAKHMKRQVGEIAAGMRGRA